MWSTKEQPRTPRNVAYCPKPPIMTQKPLMLLETGTLEILDETKQRPQQGESWQPRPCPE